MNALSIGHRATLCAIAASWVLGALGCANNTIARTMLPNDVIAVRYWQNEDARRRNEMLAEATGQAQS